MRLNYELQKKWFGFWQKYQLKTYLKIASKLMWIFIFIWLIGSILTILSQWAFKFCLEDSLLQFKYAEYFWKVIIELVSGFDIQDDFHWVSKIISVIMLITGIIIFAIFTGQIVSMFIYVLQRSNHFPEKPDKFKFKRPIIIFGINNKLFQIIKELRMSCLSSEREIVVIDNESDKLRIEDKEVFKDVWYVKGNQADRNILEKTIGQDESSAIILSQKNKNTPNNRYLDSKAIEIALAIEGYQESTHTVVELTDERNIPHLKHTKINEWISIFEYGIKLIAQSTLQHGMASIYNDLLGGNKIQKTNQIYISSLPDTFSGFSYEKIRDTLHTNRFIDVTLIGFEKFIGSDRWSSMKIREGSPSVLRQINPVSSICTDCKKKSLLKDKLGRVQTKCPKCFYKEKEKNIKAVSNWFFPKDTLLNTKDKLIYLSEKPVNFEELSIEELSIGRRGGN